MKSKLATIFITVGLFTILGQTVYRVQREKSLLEVQMQVQRASLVEGLNSAWRSFLLNKAQQGELDHRYLLRWNRKGSELREVFFPMKKSNMDWGQFREHQKAEDQSAIRSFLKTALNRDNSWDRVLAISEWKNISGSYPEAKTNYEETLINNEAKNAYRAIFEQFSESKDFTFTSDKFELDKVFYRVTADGSIEAFVPSITSVSGKVLSEFIKKNNLPSASVGEMPWDLSLPTSLTEQSTFSYFDFIWLALGGVLLVLGIGVYFGGLKEQKAALLKRVSFLNQVVHELKTPLAGLKLHLQLIQRGAGTEQNMAALETSLDRLNRLFDDVVLMNRPFEKVSPKTLSTQELKTAIEELVEEFGQAQMDEFSGEETLADAKRLRVILRNLLKNAIRYGKVAKISVSKNEDEVFIDVQDEGPGVSESDSRRIFEEFYRSAEAKSKNADGLGLGLYLVSKMAKEMGATVQLVNPGQSRAIFRLILRRSN